MTEIVRRRINKGKSKEPKKLVQRRISAAVMKLLEAMGKIKSIVPKASCYTRHQGPRECARRVRQMKQPTTST